MKRLLKGAAVGAAGCASIVATASVPAFASTTQGGETVSVSSPFSVAVANYPDGPGTPTSGFGPAVNQGVITGSGFPVGASIFLQICDGTPSTTSGYNTAAHCAAANSAVFVQANGTFSINTAQPSFQFEIFHGEDEADNQFNCLAPGDSPTGGASSGNIGTTAVGGQPIDTGLASWGSSQGANPDLPVGQGGGSAPCQLRIGDSTNYTTNDVFIPLTNLDGTPGPTGGQAPESPLAVALPVSAVAILAAGGGFALRRRRRSQAAA